MCRNALCEVTSIYDLKDFEAEKKTVEEKRLELHKANNERKNQLKVLLTQKVKDLANAAENEDLNNETYDTIEKDLFAEIHVLKMQIKELNDTAIETPDIKDKLKNALEVVDKIIAEGSLDRRDIKLLIEKIVVNEDGMPEITSKYGLSNLIS